MSAPNNRTLTISEEERELLRADIILPHQVNHQNYLNKIVCGDMKEVIHRLPKGFADLIILDPPYNLNKQFGKTTFKATKPQDYAAYLQEWFSQVVECLSPTGTLYLCGDWKSSAILQQTIAEHLTILNRITWKRDKGRGANLNWKNCLEDIWFAVRNPKSYTFHADAVKILHRVRAPYTLLGKAKDWQEDKQDQRTRLTYASNFWDDLTIPFWSMTENTEHPTQKPEKLLAKLILASSNQGDTIFDPFLGSGTSAVVAKKLNRNYIGIEQDETYAMLSVKRLRIAENDKRIQGYSKGVFHERNVAER